MDARKTISLLMVFMFLNLSLGAAMSSAALTGSSEDINYTVRVSKDSGTVLVQTGEGGVIYQGTSDVGAIKAAVNAIDSGIILIDSGTYMISSPVSLKSNIEVVGNNAVLKGYKIFSISSATNVKVSGLEFTGPDALYGSVASSSGLINIVNSKNILIEDNTFRNFRDYGVNVAVSSTSHSNENITISHNEFLDYGYCGVMIWKQSNYIYVEDNTFKNINTRAVNGNAYGIAIAKGSNSYKHSEYIYIRHNWIENSPIWEGIDSHGANHVYIQDNTVLNCKVPIAVSYQTSEGSYPLPVHDIVITGNYVKGNMNSPYKQHSGIHVLGARNYAQPYTNINVSGNTIMDVNSWLVSDDGAIVLRDVNGGIIDNNLITGVGGTGINLQNADKLVIQNNEIKNLIPISGSTKGIEMQAVVKSFSTTIRDNDFDSSVGYHGYANSGYTYYTTLINEVQSKFGGYLSLSVQTDTPATSTVDPPLTPPEPRPLEETNDSDNGTDTNTDTGTDDGTDTNTDTGTDGSTDTETDAGTDTGNVTDIEHDISVSKYSGTTYVKTSEGEVLHSGNNDAEALRAAVDAIDQGIILVDAGTYTVSSQVSLKSGIEMLGNDAVMKGYSIFGISDATDVKVTGFTFSDPDQSYLEHAGSTGLVEVENSENALIENNTFSNFRDYGVYLETPTTSSYNKEITIQDNEFLDYGYAGVMIGKQASNVVVENNMFKEINTGKLNGISYGVAVAPGSSEYQYSEYIYITNNTIENNPVWEGIDSLGANYLFIEDNEIIDCRIPISVAQINTDGKYPVPVHDVSITGNYIEGDYTAEKQDSGIYVLGGHDSAWTSFQPYKKITVSENTIVDVNNWLFSDDGAIVLQNVDEASVDNNEISGVGGTAVNLENADNVIMQNNNIKDIRKISGSTKGIELLPISKDYSLTLKNNTFDGSADYDAYAYSDYENVYEISVTEQDTSKFYTSNGAINLTVQDEVSPEPEPETPPTTNPEDDGADDVVDVAYDISVSKDAGTTVVKTANEDIVYSGSNDAEALQAAVNAIDQGIIQVEAGTYTVSSQVSLKSGIHMLGNDAVMKGYSIFRISDATDVKVTGFTFGDPDQAYLEHAGSTGLVEVENSEKALIENNTFSNFRDYGVYLETSGTSSNNKEITIQDNEFLDYGYAGVMIGKQASNVVVENNMFKEINTGKLNGISYGVAVAPGSSEYQYSEYIYIRNNTIENNPVWEGIDSLGANYLFIEDNEIIDCRIPISVAQINTDGKYPVPVHDVSITGNYIEGNYTAEKQDSGIYVLGGRNSDRTIAQPYIRANVSDNTIVDVNNWLMSDDGAIVLRHVKYAVVKSNDISGTGGTGINLEDADEVVMQDNVIKNIKEIAGSKIGVKMLPVRQDNNLTLRNNTFDGSATYNAYSNAEYGNIYQVNLVNQDTSKFDTSNGGMELVTLSEPEPETPPVDDEEETPSIPEEDEYPVANLAIRFVPSGNGLTFDGGESTDDNGIVSYSWDFDSSDGIQEEATGETVTREFPVQGRFEVTMTVTDISGQQDTDSILIVVN
ncbi:right-handed parallel beta-helix repeat-containing protein [Methanolobus zinderi]|uniref:Right-handed parallel beta-helix repeat-containing protein n=2 Tax=Methanolobus zinderi TaxID=536044 RepID=A0A7D5EDR7_9EURY|nr:right-handed parallel beta-helix repeat-containing protein [Methanolobus zinderi]